jgi:stage II sporulation protein D (peptidoglycan lytic transglycosylase)
MMARKTLFLLSVLFLFLSFSGRRAFSENIRVVIANNQRVLTLTSSSGFLIGGSARRDPRGKIVLNARSVRSAVTRVRSAGAFTGVNGKRFRGWLELRKKRNGLLLVINDLDLEEYLNGVVAAEMPHDWEGEALKAQAVAARTYALYRKRTSGRRPYHIFSTVNSQVYNGGRGERGSAAEAVRATRGLVLVYRGKIIPAFYHANCGGHTEDASVLWGIDEPYLKGVDCECQRIVTHGLWEKRISLSAVSNALRRMGYRVGDISDLSIGGLTPAGRVNEIRVGSGGLTFTVPGEALRTTLGNTALPSLFFELEKSGNEAVFSGRGSGHGVGMCQWGAQEMAQRGYTFDAILSHYYPGTGLARIK